MTDKATDSVDRPEQIDEAAARGYSFRRMKLGGMNSVIPTLMGFLGSRYAGRGYFKRLLTPCALKDLSKLLIEHQAPSGL